jgi:hypothetical protein
VGHLFSKEFQADLQIGTNFKDSPSRIFGSIGFSYRLDFHQDEMISIDEQKAGQNGGAIKRNAMKKSDEETLPGISKKKMRKLQKKAKRKKDN